ncbi:MAG: hypothetical protein ABSG51_10630 [Terracidiphilus sp.]
MNKHGSLLALLVFIALAAGQLRASTPSQTLTGAAKTPEPATLSHVFKGAPATASTADSRPKGHTFQVNDEKGLLLTCTAPELDTNPDTDIFNSCALAPGRTLDDVMHTFIQAIHTIQNQELKERAEREQEQKQELVKKPAQE